jgi:digeranylgeranylglycerophospholipid reductase
MKMDYEVIVVGAGPAGAMMTKELAERGFGVLCIEREIEVGYTNKSTAATPMDTFETFKLPREVAFEDLMGARVFGPTESCVVELDEPVGRVLKFRETKQYLIRQAIKSGAHVMLGTTVDGVTTQSGKITGVSYDGPDGKGKVTANVIVDASGPAGILAIKLGLWKKRKEDIGVAFEYFMENVKPVVAKNNKGYYMDFYMGSPWAPGGYGWIFPTGPTEAKAGVCKLWSTHTVTDELTQRQYFEKIKAHDPQLKDAQPFELHQCEHYITDPIDNSVLDNFMAIGDAVNKVHPIFGEGVRASFYSAMFAAQAIENARKSNDYSASKLGLYDKLWQDRWGKNWKFARHAQKQLYGISDESLDILIKKLGKLNPGTLLKLYMGSASAADRLKLAAQMPSMLDKQIVGKIIRRFK